MTDNRGIDTDPGWINRKFRKLEQAIADLGSERRFRNLPTTSATANMVVNATTGEVARSTSSARFKQDIVDIDVDLAATLRMRPRAWRDKRDVRRAGEAAPMYVGFIAEELDEAGLGVFVGYDLEGKPESVHYDRLTVALFIVCRLLVTRTNNLAGRATDLETDVGALKTSGGTLSSRVTAHTTRLTALETKVAELTSKATAQDDAIAALTARVAALESPPAEPQP